MGGYYNPRSSYGARKDYYDQFGIDRQDRRDLARQGYDRDAIRRMERQVPDEPWGGKPFYKTDLGRHAEMQNPQTALTRYGARLGFDGQSTFDNWFRSQYGRILEGLSAAQSRNPFLNPSDYLRRLGPGGGGNVRRTQNFWQDKYAALTPEQRGENPLYANNQQRWIV